MCDWVNFLYSKKLTEHCKPAIMEKIKIIKKKKRELSVHTESLGLHIPFLVHEAKELGIGLSSLLVEERFIL